MNVDLVILVAALVGLVVNTLAILTVAWRGGQIIGTMTSTMAQLSQEVHQLRVTRDEHSLLLARAIAQLDDVERRVTNLERP